jgi:hypothetical protein
MSRKHAGQGVPPRVRGGFRLVCGSAVPSGARRIQRCGLEQRPRVGSDGLLCGSLRVWRTLRLPADRWTRWPGPECDRFQPFVRARESWYDFTHDVTKRSSRTRSFGTQGPCARSPREQGQGRTLRAHDAGTREGAPGPALASGLGAGLRSQARGIRLAVLGDRRRRKVSPCHAHRLTVSHARRHAHEPGPAHGHFSRSMPYGHRPREQEVGVGGWESWSVPSWYLPLG